MADWFQGVLVIWSSTREGMTLWLASPPDGATIFVIEGSPDSFADKTLNSLRSDRESCQADCFPYHSAENTVIYLYG